MTLINQAFNKLIDFVLHEVHQVFVLDCSQFRILHALINYRSCFKTRLFGNAAVLIEICDSEEKPLPNAV